MKSMMPSKIITITSCLYPCGKISEIQEDLLSELEQRIEMQGFKIVDHELKFFGYCPDCT